MLVIDNNKAMSIVGKGPPWVLYKSGNVTVDFGPNGMDSWIVFADVNTYSGNLEFKLQFDNELSIDRVEFNFNSKSGFKIGTVVMNSWERDKYFKLDTMSGNMLKDKAIRTIVVKAAFAF